MMTVPRIELIVASWIGPNVCSPLPIVGTLVAGEISWPLTTGFACIERGGRGSRGRRLSWK